MDGYCPFKNGVGEDVLCAGPSCALWVAREVDANFVGCAIKGLAIAMLRIAGRKGIVAVADSNAI